MAMLRTQLMQQLSSPGRFRFGCADLCPVKATTPGNLLVIEKAQVDAELMKLSRLCFSLHRSHEDAEVFNGRLANFWQDLTVRQDTSGDSQH